MGLRHAIAMEMKRAANRLLFAENYAVSDAGRFFMLNLFSFGYHYLLHSNTVESKVIVKCASI